MVCHKYKCIFIHQRKCAGTSIIRSFGYTPKDKDWHMFNDGPLGDDWAQKELIASDYYVFSIVRNPWERFVSGWKYLNKFKNKPLDDVLRELPESGADYRHLVRPQLDVLVDAEGELVTDFVIRFENLEEDFKTVCEFLGKPYELGHLNKTSHNSLREISTKSQFEVVGEFFKKDIDFFNYKTTSWNSQ